MRPAPRRHRGAAAGCCRGARRVHAQGEDRRVHPAGGPAAEPRGARRAGVARPPVRVRRAQGCGDLPQQDRRGPRQGAQGEGRGGGSAGAGPQDGDSAQDALVPCRGDGGAPEPRRHDGLGARAGGGGDCGRQRRGAGPRGGAGGAAGVPGRLLRVGSPRVRRGVAPGRQGAEGPAEQVRGARGRARGGGRTGARHRPGARGLAARGGGGPAGGGQGVARPPREACGGEARG
mmetsp:Transcript_24536/g.83902  ORF Transcript_24536/g.83902 Transcript_24536/m.83902 type:complete len:232 (-) Transcript_24536:1582-2277(-)